MDVVKARQAVVKAHRAGDTEAARRIAGMIKTHEAEQNRISSFVPEQRQEAREQEEPTLFGNVIPDRIAQGATGNFSDEIEAGVGAIGEEFFRALTFQPPRLAESYNERKEAINDRMERGRELYPITSAAAEIGGAVGLGLVAPTSVGTRSTMLKNVAQGIAEGAGYGALFGAGSGESASERIDQAAGGAAFGAAIGLGATGVGQAANALLPKGAQSTAVQKVKRAFENDDLSVDQVAARLGRAQDQGVPMTVADVGADNTLGLARSAALEPGPGKRIINSRLARRNANQSERVQAGLERGLGGSIDDAIETHTEILTRRSQNADPAYLEAYSKPFQLTNAQLDAMGTPSGQTAVRRAERMMADKGISKDSAVAFVDHTKRALDDMIGAAVKQGQTEKVGTLRGLKSRIVSPLRQRVPAYQKALEEFAGDSALINALDEGRSFMRGDTTEQIGRINRMSQGEREAFRLGMMRELQNVIDKAPDSADIVKRVFGSATKRKLLREAFPSAKAFRRFQTQMMREAKMRRTLDAIRGGSRTAVVQREQAQEVLSDVAETATDMAAGSPISLARNLTRRLKGNNGLPPEVSREVAELMMADSPEALRKAIELLEQSQRQSGGRVLSGYAGSEIDQVIRQ